LFRFNNCHKRDHVDLYGNDAFFDLDLFGSQATDADRLARELSIGDICIVATPDVVGDLTCDIPFDSYRFSGEKIMRDRERAWTVTFTLANTSKQKLLRERTRNAMASTNISLTSTITSNDGRSSVEIMLSIPQPKKSLGVYIVTV
jgi:hypothetical protein